MKMEKTFAPLAPATLNVLETLKTAQKPLTVAELKTLLENVNPAQLTALVNRGYATAEQVEITVMVPVKRKVNAYTFVKDAE